jgi:hypothetical protein
MYRMVQFDCAARCTGGNRCSGKATMVTELLSRQCGNRTGTTDKGVLRNRSVASLPWSTRITK